MDDFDAIWDSITGGASFIPGESANTAFNWSNFYNSLDAFEQDWQDVIGGRYTINEVAYNQDLQSDQGLLDWVSANAPAGFVDGLVKTLGGSAANFLRRYLYNPSTGKINTAGLATAAAALYGMAGKGFDVQTGGYNKPVPRMTAVREQVPYEADPNRRPGEGGRRYFSDTQYVPEDGDVGAARAAAQEQAQGIASAMPRSPVQTPPAAGIVNAPWNQVPTSSNLQPASGIAPALPTPEQLTAQGGIAMAQGGQVPNFQGPLENNGFVVPGDVVRHADPAGMARKEAGLQALHQQLGAQAIRGPGDAMSDSIPTTIEGQRPAAVANGEAYVPRQQVADIGGGDPERGADKLYNMMERMRKERTGSTRQINPDNPQELARAYQGGSVARFATGGTPAAAPPAPPVGTEYGASAASTLSPWVGDYVTTALGQGAAAAATPFQAYQGPLTAGPSQLQQQAFAGIGSLAQQGFTPQQYQTQGFGGAQAQQRMNPYLQAALDPQMREMQRQADIARTADAARLTQAGGFGGSRQAIMESEGRRNLLDAQSRALAEGYGSAYDRAMQQFNTEEDRRLAAERAGESSRQYSAEFGLRSLGDLSRLGEVQRGIESEGIAADRSQFEEERDWMYKMPQYQLGLLSGLPIGATTTTPNTTGLDTVTGQIKALMNLYEQMGGQ
jgi:hypothetical protein